MITRYEKPLFFLSLTLMLLIFHFIYISLNGLDYKFPFFVLALLVVPLLPSLFSNPIFHFLKIIFMKIGHLNSMILYFIIYYFVLTPVGLFRKKRCDLNFGDSKNNSFLISRNIKQWDLERPY